ncbi:MAG: MBL fold metallo-hydrolase [Ichthyobacteriaceae bacterium]|nr:MBL fold metallo-hydrolase [Ichthyobacteriaceae bacterium]
MKNNTLTFLGTGTSQGIPVPGSSHPVSLSENKKDKRLRSSVLLEMDNANIVIDCGPDFRYQMLREKVNDVDGIFLTHEHSDHIAGMDDIRPYYFKLDGDMPVFGQQYVLDSVKVRFPYIFFQNKYPGAPGIEPNIICNDDFTFKGHTFTPIKVDHGKLKVLGYRINDLVYITDASNIPEDQYEKLKNVDTLIINALRHEVHHSHFSLKEALEVVEKVKPNKAYFTHISQHLGFHNQMEKILPKNVHLAFDTLKVKF